MRRPVPGGRRVVSVLVPWLLVLAACGGGDDGKASAPADTSSTTLSSAGGDTTAAPGATTTDGSGGTAGGPTSDGTGSGGSLTTTTAAVDSVIAVGSTRVGQIAPALLRPGRGDRVVLEVRAQSGAAPTSDTIDHLVRVLGTASGKPVSVDGIDTIGGGARDWTQKQIIQTAASAAQVESGRRQVVIRLLFLRGTYDGDQAVLGVAVAGDVAAVFSDQVDSAAGLLVSPAVVEDAVAMHEVGHLLALVDLVLGTGRADPDHPGHSRNKRSVMYWQVDSDLITQLLDGGIPTEFDADDRAELAQIRAG